jgi:hypothetical protein
MNPFIHAAPNGQKVETTTTDGRIDEVRDFSRHQCLEAMRVDGVQGKVRVAIQMRLRALERQDGSRK